MHQFYKRILDICLLFLLLAILWPIIIIISIYIKIFGDSGPVLYWSKRVGMGNDIFLMPKYRTMKSTTPELASHLLHNPNQYLIIGGDFLRRSSLDELPQLWSILCSHMSFVGPRPALFNQHDLIELRSKAGVQNLKPGLTGWAQINGRDDLTIEEKVAYDHVYLGRQSISFDIKIIGLTFLRLSAEQASVIR